MSKEIIKFKSSRRKPIAIDPVDYPYLLSGGTLHGSNERVRTAVTELRKYVIKHNIRFDLQGSTYRQLENTDG